MGIPLGLIGVSLTLLLLITSTGVSSPADRGDPDYDYQSDQAGGSDWIKDYDPWNNPPCPHWNPVDGCGRTPARTKPPTTTPSAHERTTPTPEVYTTRIAIGNKLKCSQDEVKDAACLNGGDCFALDLTGRRSAHCQCSEMWTGTRCEEIDQNIFVLSADKVEKAGIAAGVVVLIIIATVVIVYAVVKKRKRRKERAQANGNANGHAGKALMGTEKEATDSEDAEKCTDV